VNYNAGTPLSSRLTDVPPPTTTLAPPSDDTIAQLHTGSALVVFFETPFTVEQHVLVQEDGTIALLSNRVFTASGKTRGELEREVRDYYVPRFFGDVRIMTTDPPIYIVSGEVRSPGLRVLMGPTTLLKAIDLAGGFTGSANRKKVQLIREGTTHVINCVKAERDRKLDMEVLPGDRIVVPRKPWLSSK
jgi:polysaccharide export outer membrane protein